MLVFFDCLNMIFHARDAVSFRPPVGICMFWGHILETPGVDFEGHGASWILDCALRKDCVGLAV